MTSESIQHRKIKEIVSEKLKEWTGATLQEYPSSGHELDVFAVTPTGISIYVEIIWSSSRSNFFRDMSMIQTSDANVKLVVASPKILSKKEYQRQFEKVAISQRRLNFAMHGDLIDGEKIITEPKFVKKDLRSIVMGLIEYVKIRGKVVGVRAEFEPPTPPSADEITEQLLSNLFLVKKYPTTIFSGPTTIRSTRSVYEKLGDKIAHIPFLPKNKRLYTFDDLRKSSSPFLPIISEGNIVMEKTSDWICEEYRRNDLTYLFNLAVRKYCQKRELYYDKDHRRFVCRLKNERTNFFVWRPETKFATRRIASLVRAEDGSVLYGRHYAARLGIVFIDSDLFLKIEPTMTFTYDGHRPIQAKRLASLMSRYLPKQYNNAYLDFVRFWGKFLSKLDANISIPVGEGTIEIDSNPIATPVAVGIAKERGS